MNAAVSMWHGFAGNINVTMRCLSWPDAVQGVVVRKVPEPCLAVQSTVRTVMVDGESELHSLAKNE